MPLLVALAIIVLVTALAAVMSAEVAASALVPPGRIMRLVDAERRGAVSLDRLMDAAYRFRASAGLVSAAAYASAAAGAAWSLYAYADLSPAWSAILGTLASAAFVFSVGHALPRTIAVQNPEDVALAFAPAAYRVTRIVYVPAKVLGWPWVAAMRLTVGEEAAASPWITEDEYRSGAADDENAAREGAEEALLEAVSDFADKVVREVMVPRTDMTCIPDTASAAEAIELIEKAGYSRLPLYHETLDDIRGVLYAKDLLSALARDPEVRPAQIARVPHFIPETKPVQELLIEMRAQTHIALVADEYGGTAGLVTIEDLLEEIVGEIFDEYDLEIPLVTELGAGRYRVDARLPVDDLNERFGTAIESETDTVGGAVIEVAGRIPVEGDTVEIEGLRFVVDNLQGTRIRELVVEPAGANSRRGEDLDAESDSA